MNINKEELSSLRSELESKYNKLEREINVLYSKDDEEQAIKKEELQDLVDQQIDLIDLILGNLEMTPEMYKELMKINKEYQEQLGE